MEKEKGESRFEWSGCIVYGKITHTIKIIESEFDKNKARQILNSFGESYQKWVLFKVCNWCYFFLKS